MKQDGTRDSGGGVKVRLHALDGLRGWAALAVVLGHLTFNVYPCNLLLLSPFTDTKFAVSVFFVLSGFVLSYKYIGNKIAFYELIHIIAGRYVRLTVPILFVAITVFVLYKTSLIANIKASNAISLWNYPNFYSFKLEFLDALKFGLSDVYFRYNSSHTYIPPAWTMSMEFMGSLLIYFLLFSSGNLYGRKAYKPMLIFLCIVSFASGFLKFSYAPFFIYGYLIAHFFKSRMSTNQESSVNMRKEFVYIVLFLITLMVSSMRTLDRNLAMELPALSVVIIMAILGSDTLKRLFNHPVSQFLGKISFPLYLVHVPIYCSFSSHLMLYLVKLSLSDTSAYLITYVASVALSILIAFILLPVERASISLSRSVKTKSWNMILNKTRSIKRAQAFAQSDT